MRLGTSLAVTALALSVATAHASAQTAREQIAAGYELLHRGEADAASRHFEALHKGAPGDLAVRFGWLMSEQARIDFDPARTPAFEKGLDAIIEIAAARYRRTHQDSEALLYLANAHLLRATFRFEHDRGMWGAARDGANAKSYIDTYAKDHPGDTDGYFVLGTYNYFADIVPALFKVVRFFLFLPAGNRVEGLKQIERASESRLFGPTARLMLMEIYAQFEGRPDDALRVGEALRSQYRTSDAVARGLAEVHASPAIEDHARAALLYGEIATRHRSGTSVEGRAMRYRALFAQASQLQEHWRTEEAIAILSGVIDTAPANPAWVMPQFLLRRGNLRALIDDPEAADDPQRVLKESTDTGWRKGATDQIAWIAQRRASGEAARYAALIPANRLVADAQWDEARRLYDAVRAREPQNLHVQYRLAVLDFQSGLADRSAAAFTQLAASRGLPVPMRAMSLLYTARIHDLAGRRAEALRIYQQVVDRYENERADGLARAGLLAPYRRRIATAASAPSSDRRAPHVTQAASKPAH